MGRILFVEDEPALAIGVRDDLEIEGHTVELVSDGEAAFQRACAGRFDLILLDVMLPGKDGFTVCQELRAAGITTPIVMLTARGEEIDHVLGLELGADDYITKPFSRRELQARVKAALRRTFLVAEPAGKVSEFGDVRIDFERCQAWRGGQQIELTALEFRLMQALTSRRGKLATLDDLNREAWGPGVFISDRTVYTHMNNLRGKIEADPRNPRHLITVRGAGYRLEI
jgi:DNA-binding response OmpR family regulator